MQNLKRILAVDDSPVNLRILKSILVDFDLRTAKTGAEALKIAPSFRPDLVLLDILMPGIDGYETCRKIRDDQSLRHTKIIMLSAKSALSERILGYEAGADDYVTKPFDCDELIAKVAVFLKLKSVEEVEEIKNRTIEVLQHSNRTPLNNIISYAELLSCGHALDDATRAEIPKVIIRNAIRLHQLLEKGETLASMKCGQFSFEFEAGDICDIIRNVFKEVAEKISDRNIIIELMLPSSMDSAFDHTQLQFVFRAMLENAIRFSEPGGVISVCLNEIGGKLILKVADQGIGITEEMLPRVFEAFGNPDSPLFNQGDGLSLAIAQQIAWNHDGDIQVESQLGRGASFSLSIPIRYVD